MGLLPGSGNAPESSARSAPAGSVIVEARRAVWECPTTSLSKDTMVMRATAIVIIRGRARFPRSLGTGWKRRGKSDLDKNNDESQI